MNIGIILPSLEPSQLSYEVITAINREIMAGSKHDYRIFFEDLSSRIVNPLCAVMNVAEIWNYDGLLITTTLKNTALAAKTTGNIHKVFYVWDLEWMRGQQNYLYNISLYRNQDFFLFTRSQYYANLIKNYANRQVDGIMEEFTFGDLCDAITGNR